MTQRRPIAIRSLSLGCCPRRGVGLLAASAWPRIHPNLLSGLIQRPPELTLWPKSAIHIGIWPTVAPIAISISPSAARLVRWRWTPSHHGRSKPRGAEKLRHTQRPEDKARQREQRDDGFCRQEHLHSARGEKHRGESDLKHPEQDMAVQRTGSFPGMGVEWLATCCSCQRAKVFNAAIHAASTSACRT